MSTKAIILVFAAAMLAMVSSACIPAVPTADSTINPVSYNPLLSSFSNNGPNTNSNNTALLNLSVQWNATQSRTLKWIGIGSGSECTGDINSPDGTNLAGFWTISSSNTDCTITASASYIWPQAFYNTTSGCNTEFSITTDTGANTETLTFLIFVQYEDCVDLTRNGATFTQCQNITTQLPVSIIFPTNTSVTTLSPIAVFSASSINITAALASQTLTLDNPALQPTATFSFVTYIGESFQLDPNSGIIGPVSNVQIELTSNTITTPTRRQLWTVRVPVSAGACNINGLYSTNFTIYYTAVNGSGTLPPDQNPIPNNASAFVNFTIISADFCADFFNPTISAVLFPYLLNTTSYFDGASTVAPHRGFLTGDYMYLAARVTSDFLPILTTKIVKVYTATSENPAYVTLDVYGNATLASLLDYGAAQGGVDSKSNVIYPRTDAVAWFILDPSIFVVPGDRNVQYNFQVDIIVTYNNNGQKKRQQLSLRQSIGGSGSGSQLTQASTFALIAAGAPSLSSALSVSANFLAVCAAVVAALLLM